VTVEAPPALSLHRRLLHGLADPSRLRILEALRAGERRVSDLCPETGLSQPNLSKHLACLWGCGLVARERRGREVYYRSIDGIDELFGAIDGVIEAAGETIGACPLTDETLDLSSP
jgi:ArsR family transcriptional regulator, cadmium/lead-responsive transcriptional repressor